MDKRTCIVADCATPIYSQRMCQTHVKRLRRTGTTDAPRQPTVRDRLLARIEQDEAGCWLWTGYLNRDGYGHLRVGKRFIGVHRVAYEEFAGPIPGGYQIDHLCRVRNCINPAHLEAVTLRENVLRSESPAAKQARKTHCFRGHELAGENLHASGRHRYCRECKKISNRAAGKRRVEVAHAQRAAAKA